MNEVLELFWLFFRLSLLSFGGALGILPELERELVGVRGWITPRAFSDGYALAQFSPGPNMLAVVFYGYHVSGLLGAVAALLGMFAPAAIITGVMAHAWGLLGDAPWPRAIRSALLPVGAGLALGGALTLARGAITDLPTALIAGAAFGLVMTKVNPVVAVLTGGLVGAVLGWFGPK